MAASRSRASIAAQPRAPRGGPGPDDLDDRLFALTHEERVEEGVHRLRVHAGGAAGKHQRLVRPVGREERDAGQVERRQDVGVELLVGQGEAEHVELGQRVARLERVERQALALHRVEHVDPRRVRAFGEHVGLLIDDVVEDREAEVGHAEVVDVGEDERDLVRRSRPSP